jgi:hypothetical protein
MLYDKRWDKQLETRDPFTLESLIAWLEKQPANKVYCYGDLGSCLAARYNASIGRRYSVAILPLKSSDDKTFDEKLERIAVMGPHTFGAALERARAALQQRNAM